MLTYRLPIESQTLVIWPWHDLDLDPTTLILKIDLEFVKM